MPGTASQGHALRYVWEDEPSFTSWVQDDQSRSLVLQAFSAVFLAGQPAMRRPARLPLRTAVVTHLSNHVEMREGCDHSGTQGA